MGARPQDGPSWVFDLIAHDDPVRRRALERHRELLAATEEALRWSNRVWAQAGGNFAPTQAHLAAEMDQARAAYRWHREQTIFGPIGKFLAARGEDAATRSACAPYAVLYLRWEARHPMEWRAESSAASPWSCKELVLRALGDYGVPEQVRAQLAELTVTVLLGPYRCKDWRYAPLVRHLVDDRFVDAVTTLLDADDALVRLRAQFVLDIARHPDRRVNRTSWRRWLATDHDA